MDAKFCRPSASATSARSAEGPPPVDDLRSVGEGPARHDNNLSASFSFSSSFAVSPLR